MKIVWYENGDQPQGIEIPDSARVVISVSPNIMLDIQNNEVRTYEPDDIWITEEGKLSAGN
jgi:hypothetical protein